MGLGERIRKERLARGWRLEDVAVRAGMDVATVSALEIRKSKKSQYASALARAFDIPLADLLGTDNAPPMNEGEALDLSVSLRKVAPQQMSWEQLLNGDEPPELFHCAIPDDSAAPDFPRGLELIWSPRKAPAIGSLVIVRDRAGALHVRTYAQGRAPGQWVASATNRHYASFDGDDLTVVAVAAYMALP